MMIIKRDCVVVQFYYGKIIDVSDKPTTERTARRSVNKLNKIQVASSNNYRVARILPDPCP